MGGVLVRLFVFVCSPLLKHVAYISVAASSCERPSFTFFSQFAKLSILVDADLSVCLSASLTYPGVTIAEFSTSDRWRLSPDGTENR